MGGIKSSKISKVNAKDFSFIKVNSTSENGSTILYDPEVFNYVAAIISNGGSISTADLTSVHKFVINLKNAQVWDRLVDVGLFCGNNLSSALVKIKTAPGTNSVMTNINFVEADYGRTTGLKGNGTTKYLKIGVNPSRAMTFGDSSFGVYNASSVAADGGSFGARTSAASTFQMFHPFSDSVIYADQYNTTNSAGRVAVATTNSSLFGLIVCSRTSTSLMSVYRRGNKLGTTTGTSIGTLPNAEMFVFASNDAGTPVFYSSYFQSMYFVGSGLTAAQIMVLNGATEQLQFDLGRFV